MAIANFLAWSDLLAQVSIIAYVVKFISILPPIILAYYFCSSIFENKTNVRRVTFLYTLVALAYLITTFRQDLTNSTVAYWGVQWQVSPLPLLIYLLFLLLPLGIAAVYLIGRSVLESTVEKRTINLTLYFSVIIFVFLEYVQIGATVVTWQRLLARLLYILIAFSAYMYFSAWVEERRFIPWEEKIVYRKQARVPFFVKLFFLFILLAVIPITISSLLMFLSFKEIIDLYIYKPLLWNLKTSREAFLMALTHVQVQALFLMILTGLLVGVASVVVSRAIAERLRRISMGMKRVSQGDFTFKIRRDSNDEIGDVVNYFNDMSAEIKRSREIMENWNRELEIKVAERTEDLRILCDVLKAMSSSLDLELLIKRTIERLLPVMEAEAYAILIPDEKGVFSVRFCEGCSREEFKEGGWPPGWVATPLRAKGEDRGILLLKMAEPDERKKNLLNTISDSLAVALENVGIYEKEKEAVARLTELDRLKSEFISMVSHELRTPVTSVDGYISLFLAGATGPISEDQRKYLTIVKENDKRLLTLINRLLDFSRIETGRFTLKRELISIHEIIHSAVDSMRPQLKRKNVDLKLKLGASNVNFMGDREKMGEVFINLIENAMKFGKEGEPVRIEITTKDAGDFIEVEVADNGVGIDAEYLEKIFNKFFQLEETLTRKVGGVGLGLAIVKEIIGNHNGKIWAESEGRGKGARFIFTIPVAEKV